MNGTTRWTWVILFGSVWGLSEVFGGELLYSIGAPLASMWLTAVALLLLTVCRGVFDRFGTSILAGGVAALFKLAATAPHYCHLLAVVGLAVIFDVISTASTRWNLEDRRPAVVAAISAIAGAASFAFMARFVVGFPHWIDGGIGMLGQHVLVGGGASAVLAGCLAPFAFRLGGRAGVTLEAGPRRAFILPMAATTGIWMLVMIG